MNTDVIIPLNDLKRYIWKYMRSSIRRDVFPHVTRYIIGDSVDSEYPLKIQINLSKGDYFQPEKIFVEVQLQNYRCTIQGLTGTVSAIFEIPDIEIDDCRIHENLINIDFVSDEFWQSVDFTDIERFIADDWNGQP